MTLKENISGLQHFAVPTQNMDETVAFYESLGFHIQLKEKGLRGPVIFMEHAGVSLEFYIPEATAKKAGAVDHFALDVKDIEAAFTAARQMNLNLVDAEIQSRPFWKNGVRFFSVLGPNQEKIEFSQKL